ncbi:hypothetical protein BGX33_003207 [Mortierella sp. NVP41]|nr:hypothetical protein BGX33_003207 [Mortierella sp. NVP41]
MTDKDFEEKVVNSGKNTLVEFYAPRCGHCKNLDPTYEKLAAVKDVVVAKVDATVEKAVAKKYGVSDYPTLKYFADGSIKEYEGGRSEEDLIRFINKHAGTARSPGSKLIDTTGHGLKAANEYESTDKNAKHYARVFEKTAESPDFIATESARLAKIIESGTISAAKMDEFSIRHNIISAFAPPSVPADTDRDEL